MITAADLNPTGTKVLVRVYTGIYEYELPNPYNLSRLGEVSPQQILLGPLDEPQGESICYGWEGYGIWSISEESEGNQPLHYLACIDEE